MKFFIKVPFILMSFFLLACDGNVEDEPEYGYEDEEGEQWYPDPTYDEPETTVVPEEYDYKILEEKEQLEKENPE